MQKPLTFALVASLLAGGILAGCSSRKASSEIDPSLLASFTILPQEMTSEDNPITPEKVALGRMLYYDTRLSRSQELSCNSCHGLETYGVDGNPTSTGHRGQKGTRNSPTVYNAAGQFAQFWDGRAADVEEQAKGPVLNPVEMAEPDEESVLEVLQSIPEYVAAFKSAFPGEKDPVNFDNMAKAIGAFERKLVTPSRWDKFVAGEEDAISAEEKAGFNTFLDAGCETCHMGAYVGGNLYQKLGLTKDWPDTTDTGRETVTHNEADRLVFKVPILRNIEKTGPYFHNGRVSTLKEAVAMMGEYQLGANLSDAQVASIIRWLSTLTGEIPQDYIKKPALPPSTKATPKPDLTE